MNVRIYCMKCRFFDAFLNEMGYCRRYAPRPSKDEAALSADAQWPVTLDSDWCGEGEPAE